ncbi:carbohydrate ABC transporter permease [Tessaracoccus sp. MC1865]|uniref:carbohydrate ABC transporter permease n=1 Tax=Tessaracoccus sp. MC1865 TaxID=2760310 RepID=UPI001FD77DA3|nr:sugar ABC transporter permease [Tessaracoccus sp. MC1865]
MERTGKPGFNQRLLAFLHLTPGMAGFFIFIVVPLIASLVISLYNWPLYGEREFVGVENYVQLLSGADPVFFTVLRNTAVFAIGYTIANLIVCTGIAVWLHSLPEWGGFFRILFFIPVVTPMVANALVWRLMLQDNGLVNTLLGNVGITGPSWLGDGNWALVSLIMMSLWQGIGYNIVVLAAGLNNINPSVMEAARIDGTTAWSRFWRVTFPMLSPSLFFASVMTVIGGFKVFTQPYMLTKGGPGDTTNTIVLYLYRAGFSYDRLGFASAMAWVLFVIIMLFTALQFLGQKKWVSYDA